MLELAIADHVEADDETKALGILLRFLSKKTVTFSSVGVALACLQAGRKYQLWGFDQLVVSYLQQEVNVSQVLVVLSVVFPYSSYTASSMKPSAPSLQEIEKEYFGVEDSVTAKQNRINADQEMFDGLANSCLELVDEHARFLLKSDQFCLLEFPLVRIILSRDTLKLGKELEALLALERWATARCTILSLPPSPEQKQDVLGGMSRYLPLVRLLTLTPQELREGHSRTGLLPSGILTGLLRSVTGGPRCSCPLPREIKTVRKQLATPRKNYHEDQNLSPECTPGGGKVWDCEAQEYRLVEEEDDDYEHVDDCQVEPNIDGLMEQVGALGNYRWQRPPAVIEPPVRHRQEKKCTCVRVRTSRLIEMEERRKARRLQGPRMGARGIVGDGGRRSRPRSNSWGQQRQRGEQFNTFEKMFYCLACIFD